MTGSVQKEVDDRHSPPNTDKLRQKIKDITDRPTEDWHEVMAERPSGVSVVMRGNKWDDGVYITISAESARERTTHPHHATTESVGIPEVLDVFRDIGKPAVSTQEVADKTETSESAVKEVLEELETKGKLASDRTGGVTIWWVADDQDLLKGLGALKDTDIPEMMRKEREAMREEWTDVESLSR
jgi:hypothetical protein